jgi:hypothetical protein
MLHGGNRFDPRRDAEARERLFRLGVGYQFIERMTGSAQEIFGIGGIQEMAICSPSVSFMPGAASCMEIWWREAAMRGHGISMCLGLAMEMAQ